MFDFETQLRNLPDKPGVYLMKDQDDTIIYVGKAKILKNRVRQYFQQSANHILKIRMMIRHIASFEYIVTDSELDALILENNLIKQYNPKYNSKLKDDKNYPYIKVTNEAYPKIQLARRAEHDGSKYFGPYASNTSVKETIASIRKIFKIRSCSRKLPEDVGKQRPCLNHHIGQCSAPCNGLISQEEYAQTMKDAVSFLQGSYKELVARLEAEMKQASQELKFEKAAKLRDKVKSIKAVMERQQINAPGKLDTDVIAFAKDKKVACFQVFFMRGGRINGKEHYILQNVLDEPDEEILGNFIKQFYASMDFVPKEIVVQMEVSEADILKEWLTSIRKSKVELIVPQRGENKKLLDMAVNNAHITLARMTNQGTYYDANVMDLKKHLDLPVLPRRIECYDISNTGESEIVGSMVVFVDGKPRKRDYRKFKIKTMDGQNDYGSMCEMLHRRFAHLFEEKRQIEAGELDEDKAKFLPMPDLVLIDGGRGHVAAVSKTLLDLGISVQLYGLVKDDKHRTRALVREDMREVQISLNSSLYRFLYQIQEETHNYAIDFHRKRRGKAMVHSELDDIPGVGEKSRIKIQKTFRSLDEIRSLSAESIAQQTGISKKAAENVYFHFHPSESIEDTYTR